MTMREKNRDFRSRQWYVNSIRQRNKEYDICGMEYFELCSIIYWSKVDHGIYSRCTPLEHIVYMYANIRFIGINKEGFRMVSAKYL